MVALDKLYISPLAFHQIVTDNPDKHLELIEGEVHHPQQGVTVYQDGDVVDGAPVLADFRLSLPELFA